MKAIVFQGAERVAVEHVADAGIVDAGDAVVSIRRASICGSDLHLVHGSFPVEAGLILGHEAVGVVAEVGSDVRRFRVGDRVLVPAVAGCGACAPCRRGYVVGCLRWASKVYGTSLELPGAQAEAMRVPYADGNLQPAPSDVDDEALLFLTDNLPTAFYAAANAHITPGATVVVLGGGPVGLLAASCAQLFGPAAVYVIDRVPERLAMARSLGALPLDALREDVQARVLEATEGQGADAVIEAIGSGATIQQAVDLVRVGGALSIVGVPLDFNEAFPLLTSFLKDLRVRLGLVNVREYVPQLLPLLRHGKLDPCKLITHRFALERGAEAYDVFAHRRDGCLKVVLTP